MRSRSIVRSRSKSEECQEGKARKERELAKVKVERKNQRSRRWELEAKIGETPVAVKSKESPRQSQKRKAKRTDFGRTVGMIVEDSRRRKVGGQVGERRIEKAKGWDTPTPSFRVELVEGGVWVSARPLFQIIWP